jgi:nicotinamidase-related amidase
MAERGRIGAGDRNRWRATGQEIDLVRADLPARPLAVPARPADVVVDLARTALIVVDMQNDFCHPDGWLASIGVDVSPARRPIEPLAAALPALREAGLPVVWLDWGTRPDQANLPPGVLHVYDPGGDGVGIGSVVPTGAPVLERGSWGAAVVDELAVGAADVRVDKHRMSGFWDTELDSVLRNLAVTTLLFAGVNADQCVLATLVDAACIGYDVVLLEDCSATTSPPFCWEATVYNVRQCFGFTATAADLVAALGGER